MYKVIKAFADLKDVKKTKSGNIYFEYEVGDTYPRKGVSPTEDRIAELAGCDNKQGTPLIKQVEEEKPAEDKAAEEKAAEEKPVNKTQSKKKASAE